MYIVAKTIKGHEFVYSNKYSILCGSEKQAETLRDFMNSNNETALDDFKLQDNETWYVYEVDRYDAPPRYELVNTRGKVSIRKII